VVSRTRHLGIVLALPARNPKPAVSADSKGEGTMKAILPFTKGRLRKAAAISLVGSALAIAPYTPLGSMPVRAAEWNEDPSLYVVTDSNTAATQTPTIHGPGHQHLEFSTFTVRRVGTGRYRLDVTNFSGDSGNGGNVQVTAVGNTSSNRHCKVESWGNSSSTQMIDVRCFSTQGNPQDSRFALSFVRRGSRRGYVWANNPSSASYVPDRFFSHNSAGGVNTISRSGPGVYSVTLPGLAGNGGNVQVTAYGVPSDYCKVSSWGGSPLRVGVRCFNAAGTPVDTRFSAIFEESPIDFPGAFAWADQPLNPFYTPSLAYQQNVRGGPVTIQRTATGTYWVRFPGGIKPGVPLVTAYGSGSERCRVFSIEDRTSDPAQSIYVQLRCSRSNGQLVDTRFSIKHRDD
jgi:hypothetical protein